MGVMSCHRKGCESIMCDTYVASIGYVCHDCQTEFSDLMKARGKEEGTEKELAALLEAFMNTDKEYQGLDGKEPITVYDFFKKHTPESRW